MMATIVTKELNTLAPKKWEADFSGGRPTLAASTTVTVQDLSLNIEATT